MVQVELRVWFLMDIYSPRTGGRDVKEVLKHIWKGGSVDATPWVVPAWKRALDIVFILFAFPVVVPLGLVVALWIKLTSPGPVFFRQERVGLRGRRFTCLKFRSMRVGADTKAHQDYLKQLMRSSTPMTKMDAKGDSRLIPLGSLLRSMGLDELPQIINIWRGEMSVVGPRPCIPYEYEGYEPWQKRRVLALPGLTGLWQVSGKNRTTFNEMIELDTAYVENQSLWLDLWIMIRTIPALSVQVLETQRSRKLRVPSSAAVPVLR